MSFHGAVIGILLASYIFTKINKVNNFKLLDLISAASPIEIFLEGYQILSMENFMEHLP